MIVLLELKEPSGRLRILVRMKDASLRRRFRSLVAARKSAAAFRLARDRAQVEQVFLNNDRLSITPEYVLSAPQLPRRRKSN